MSDANTTGGEGRVITESLRLDFLQRNPGIVRVSKRGIKVKGVNEWQPDIRTAVDVAIGITGWGKLMTTNPAGHSAGADRDGR